MRVLLHTHGFDANRIIERCRALGVTDVSVPVENLPGFEESSGPHAAFLREYVGRLNEGGVATPVAVTFLGGKDPAPLLDPTHKRKEIDGLLRTVELAGELGIETILHYTRFAMSPNAEDDARYWEGLITLQRELVKEAEAANVEIANHAVWMCIKQPERREEALRSGVSLASYRDYRPEGWPGPYFLIDAEGIDRLVNEIPSPNHGVCFCTGMHITGGDLPSLVQRFKGRVFFAQARDIKGGRWPGSEEVILGEGNLDFVDIFGRLAGAGYDGLVGPEHLGQPRYPGEDLEGNAIAFVKKVISEVERRRL